MDEVYACLFPTLEYELPPCAPNKDTMLRRATHGPYKRQKKQIYGGVLLLSPPPSKFPIDLRDIVFDVIVINKLFLFLHFLGLRMGRDATVHFLHQIRLDALIS